MFKRFVLPLVALAVAFSSGALAKPKHHKVTHHQAAAAAAQPAPCKSGMTFISGACVSDNQVQSMLYARAMAQCATQTRINYNGCALGHYGPNAKDIFVFDQGPNGINSSPGGAASDFRFKRDVTPVALLDDGVTLYSFRYFGSDQVYVGVMAQQVAAIAPEAVTMHPGGYLFVYYDRLGLKMQTLEEWQTGRGAKPRVQIAAP